MTKLQPALWFAAMSVLGLLWLSYCHDPSVRATEKLREQTHATDSSSHLTDTRVARLAADSFQREAELARLDVKLRGAQGEIARLKSKLIPSRGGRLAEPHPAIAGADTDGVATVPQAEPAPPVDLVSQIAIRDTIIQEQDAALTAWQGELTIWKALAQERGQLLSQAISERNSYRGIIAQQKPSRFACVGGISMAVGWGRGAGVGVTCGIRL